MNKINPNLLLNNSAFVSALQGLQSFVLETGADLDMAYDWICDQAEINSFVCDLDAWNSFYEVYEGAAE